MVVDTHWRVSIATWTGIGPSVSTVGALAGLLAIHVSWLVALLAVLWYSGFAGLDILSRWVRPPTWREGVRWALAGALLWTPSFAKSLRLGSDFQYPDYLAFHGLHMLVACLVAPIAEEVLYRGVTYSALRSWNKTVAIVGSTALFFVAHTSIGGLVLRGTAELSYVHGLAIILLGLITAHIYEKTGKLSLCIVFHSAGNTFVMLAPPMGYLLDLHL